MSAASGLGGAPAVEGLRPAGQGGGGRPSLAGRVVCVLLGGRSDEREVSLVSGRAMVEALDAACARGGDVPARVLAVELLLDGRWRLEGRELEPARALLELPRESVFVLALHGGEGEGGVVQGFLESAGRAYTGAGVAASALCLDKHRTRLVLADAGLGVAPAHLVRPAAWRSARERELARVRSFGGAGWFVKPNRGGSSLGMARVEEAGGLAGAIEGVLSCGDAALVEARVRGIEATCGVLGNRGGELRALPPVEIRPHGDRFYDFEEKYSAASATKLCPPEGLDAAVCARLRELALLAHELTGCDGLSRTDFMVPEGGGEPLVLEVNTLPGMTARSLVPRSAEVFGLDFPELCLELARLGLAADRERPA